MIDYFDASAIAAIILKEPTSPAVADFVDSTSANIIVSEFALAEVSSAISRLVRTTERSADMGRRLIIALDAWVEQSAGLIDVDPSDFARATDLVRQFELKLRAPDAFHLAVAQRIDARLVTLDKNLAAAAKAIGAAVVDPTRTVS